MNAVGAKGPASRQGTRNMVNGGGRRSRRKPPGSAEEVGGGEPTLEEVPLGSKAGGSGGGGPNSGMEQGRDFVEADEDELGAGRAAYGDDLETLDRRRSEELKLIGEYDSASINLRRECWFMVDTKWLQSWAKFVRGEGPPPGRISNEALVQDDLKTPVEGLVAKVDYRGVNPSVWFLYVEMYGKDSAQNLCRYVIDLYEAEVPHKYRKEIFEEPMRRAQVEVQKMRWRVEPDEVRLPERPKLCCCITESMIDCVFMALFTCCAKCRRRCPSWLCCCFPFRTSATGGRYSRVTNSGAEGDDDEEDDDRAFEDDEIDFGAKEEDEDLVRLGRDRRQGSAPPPRRNGGSIALGTRR